MPDYARCNWSFASYIEKQPNFCSSSPTLSYISIYIYRYELLIFLIIVVESEIKNCTHAKKVLVQLA